MKKIVKKYQNFLDGHYFNNTDIVVSMTASAYNNPPRAYHSLEYHIQHCIEQIRHCYGLNDNYNALQHALWLHDYANPRQINHPELSCQAALVHFRLLGLSDGYYTRTVLCCIMATDYNIPAESLTLEGSYMRDIDCSIFGADREKFIDYRKRIRKEYSDIEEAFFIKKSREFFEKINSQEYIYHTDIFRQLYEKKARSNFKYALKKLYPEVIFPLEVKNKLEELIKKQKPVPDDFKKIVDDHFWDLI